MTPRAERGRAAPSALAVPPIPQQRAVTSLAQPKPLRAKWRDLIRDGNQGDYATDHAAVAALATAMCRAGQSYADFDHAMTDPDNRLAQQYRKKADDPKRQHNAGSYARILRKRWASAEALVNRTPAVTNTSEAMQTLGLCLAAATEAEWRGRSAIRDRAILAIIHDIAQELRTATPSISVRKIWRRSPVRGINTIVRALSSLADSGWFETDRGSDPLLPTTYRLQVPRTKGVQERNISTGVPRVHTAVPVLHPPSVHPRDRIHTQLALAFGPHAATVYATLDADIEQSKYEVVRRSGVSKRTVDKWLKTLAEVGLARRTPDGWLAGDTEADLVAAEWGSIAVELERETRIALDREGWAAFTVSRETSSTRSLTAAAQASERTRRSRTSRKGQQR